MSMKGMRAGLVLISVLVAGLQMAQATLLRGTAQPTQQLLQVTQDNRWAVSWRLTTDASHRVGALSTQALIINPSGGQTLARVGGTLSQGGLGPYQFSEFISVAQATVQSWQASGLRRVLLVREFSDLSGGGRLRVQQTLTLPAGSLLAVKVQPAQRQLLAGQDNELNLAWQLAASGDYASGVSSPQARVIDPSSGTVLASLGGRLSDTGRAPYLLRETLRLPAAQVQAWYARGLRRLLLQREFNGGGPRLSGQVVLNLTSSGLRAPRENASGELQLQRMNLSFSDNQRVKVVPADSGDLYGKLVVAYSGNGLLQGRWQVAEPGSTEGRPIYRTLTLVRRYLSAAQQTTLQSPPLPHDRSGQYRLRFCVSNPELVPAGDSPVDPGCPIEGLMVETVYEVLGNDATDSRLPLQAQPQQGVVGMQTRFSWQPVPSAVVYRLQLFALTDRQAPDGGLLGAAPGFVAGMLLPAGAVDTRLSPLMRSKLEPGQEYLWRVTAHDADGRVIGRSQEWKVRYQP